MRVTEIAAIAKDRWSGSFTAERYNFFLYAMVIQHNIMVIQRNIIHRFKRLSISDDGFYVYFYAYLLALETLIHDA